MLQCFQVAAAVVEKLKAYSPIASSVNIFAFEPADGFVDGTNFKPHAFVYMSTSEFKSSDGGESADQEHEPTFFCDVYGFGKSKAAGSENEGLAASEAAAISAQAIFSHCYDVIMDMRRNRDSFGLDDDIGGRYVRRIEAYKPGKLTDSSIGVCVIRLEFTVRVCETPPGEPDGPDLTAQGIQVIANVTDPT